MMDPNPRDVVRFLRAVRALLERGWATGTDACDADGNPVHLRSVTACAFCLRGAILRAEADAEPAWRLSDSAFVAITKAIYAHLSRDIGADEFQGDEMIPIVTHFNDANGRTKADVLAVVDAAIDALEKEVR